MPTTLDKPNPKAAFTPPESVLSAESLKSESNASPGGWFICEVGAAGPAEDGTIYIQLRDVGGAFPLHWYYAVSNERKEMLATALAAITSGFRVSAYLVSKDEYSQINRLYIVRS